MRRFYSPPENFSNNSVSLNEAETRHLRDVLRLKSGERINVFDGAGNEFLCVIEKIERRETLLRVVEKLTASRESALNLTLAVALLKGDKFDLVVQKTCELGVSRIIPLITKRADAKISDDKDSLKKLERWRKIALEAAKQSGRAALMKIEKPVDFQHFVKFCDGEKLFFSERAGVSFDESAKSKSKIEKITAIFGAEGGWEDSEIELARENNFQIITLGGRILRAETAAIAVAALLQNHFGDFN